jgi:2-polyprenyl-3-methyl-5-hydroxy-6-metoxy-1,4-benzoquinol methylase
MRDELLDKFEAIEDRHWWWEGRRKLVKDFLRRIIRNPKLRILDVGCGTGETMSFIKKTRPKCEVWGVDNSRIAIKYARSRGHKTVKYADARKLPFRAKMFDAVLALDVLEHIKNPGKVLLEIKRVLKPTGKVLITSPALKFIWSRHDVGQGHVTRFNQAELATLAKETGLETERAGYFNFILSGPIILIRVLSRFPGLGFVANYDNGVNYGVVNIKWLNAFLRRLFVAEVSRIWKIRYPWGISVMAVMVKPTM